MEEVTTLLSEDTPHAWDVGKEAYEPRLAQKVVAVILCGLTLMSLFVIYILPLFFSSYDDYSYTFYTLWPSIRNFGTAISFGFLIFYANNKATKIALSLAVCYFVISFFGNVGIFEKLWILSGDILGVVFFIFGFILVYAYSLILTNNDLSTKSKVWINLLVIFVIYNSIFFSGVFGAIWRLSLNDVIDAISWDWLYHRGNYFLNTQMYNLFFVPIHLLLYAVAYYYFACSEAFSGHYNANAKCKYSPLNKWLAAAIIGPSIMTLGIYFLYKNYQLFI